MALALGGALRVPVIFERRLALRDTGSVLEGRFGRGLSVDDAAPDDVAAEAAAVDAAYFFVNAEIGYQMMIVAVGVDFGFVVVEIVILAVDIAVVQVLILAMEAAI